jgi:fructose-1,6-bisphosphatase/inositol monophosphatase family enzyme
MLILNMVYIFGIMVRRQRLISSFFLMTSFLLIAAGDLIAREAGAYTCDPSGASLNLVHRRILCTASKELAEQISPLLTHIDFPHD